MKITTLVFTLCGLAFSAFLTNAQNLTFDSKVQKVPTAADTQKLEVFFPFKNNSKEVVHITQYDAPCSCMSAMITGGTVQQDGTVKVAPGESGVVKGIFDLGNAKGKLKKKIMLWTGADKKDAPSIVLESEVVIPKLIEAVPKSLIWVVGSQPTTKTISIKVNDTKPINIVKHMCSNTNLGYQLKTIKPGFEYQLEVTPKSTAIPIFAAVRMTTDSKNPRFKSLQTFMTVKPARK